MLPLRWKTTASNYTNSHALREQDHSKQPSQKYSNNQFFSALHHNSLLKPEVIPKLAQHQHQKMHVSRTNLHSFAWMSCCNQFNTNTFHRLLMKTTSINQIWLPLHRLEHRLSEEVLKKFCTQWPRPAAVTVKTNTKLN